MLSLINNLISLLLILKEFTYIVFQNLKKEL